MKSAKTSLFLMELIISILFFSLASATCIQLFVKSHLIDKRTMEQNHMIVWSQNLASLWQANEGDLSAVYEILSATDGFLSISDDKMTIYIYFNQDLKPCMENDMTYKIILHNLPLDKDSLLISSCISLFRKGESIFELPLCMHIALERD